MISIVLPAHNEAGYLEPAVRELHESLRIRRSDFELIVIENGSTDDTLTIAERLSHEFGEVRVLSRGVANYGAALRNGVLASRGEVVVTFDVDYFDLGFLERALSLLEGHDPPVIVVGSKRAPGASDKRPWPRRLVTAVFSMLVQFGFSLPVSDTHGMKAWRRAAVEPIVRRCRSVSDLFDTELLIRAARSGLPTAELPVTARERRPSRTPIWRRIPRTLVGLTALRIRLWREGRSR